MQEQNFQNQDWLLLPAICNWQKVCEFIRNSFRYVPITHSWNSASTWFSFVFSAKNERRARSP